MTTFSATLTPDDLRRQAIALYYSNCYTEAAAMAGKAVEAASKEFNSTNSKLADYYNLLGILCVKADKFQDAEQALRSALSIQQNNYHSNNLEIAESLFSLGEALKYLSKYDEAEQCHANALTIRKQLLPAGHKQILESLNNLAEVYRIQAKFQLAENCFNRGILSCKRTGSNTDIYSTLLHNKSYLLQIQGKYDEAETDILHSLAMTIELFGTNHPATASSFNDLGLLLHNNGNYPEAEKNYLQAIEIYTNLSLELTHKFATTKKNLAQLYKNVGMYSKAEENYMTSLNIMSKIYGNNHVESASLLNDLASLYELQEKYAEAETLYVSALSIREQKFGDNHILTAQSQNNLAKLYKSQKRYREAERYYLQALNYAERALGTNNPNVATYINNLAEVYSIQEKYLQAVQFYLKALAIREKLFGDNHPDVAATLHLLGKMYVSMEDFVRAEPLLIRALNIRESTLGKNHPKTAETEFELGKLYEKQLDYTNANKYFEKALKTFELSSVLAGGEEYSAKARTQQADICSYYLKTLDLLKKENPSLNITFFGKALWATELAKSRRFLDQLLSSSAARFGDISKKDQSRLEKTQRQLNALNDLSRKWAGKSSKVLSRIERRKGELRAKLTRLYEQFKHKYPRYMELRQPAPLNIKELQNDVLKDNEMMISYWIGESNLFASIISKHSFEFNVHPINLNNLDILVQQFRKTLEEGQNFSPRLVPFKAASYKLYKEIFKPFEKEILRNKPETLFVVPHGVLSTIPFEALISTKFGASFSELDYLFNQINIAYVPSAMALRAIRKDKLLKQNISKSRKPALLFGDPVYSKEEAEKEAKIRGIKKTLTLNTGVIRSKQPLGNIEVTATRSLDLNTSDLKKLIQLPGTRKEIKIIENIFYPQSFINSLFSNKKHEYTHLGLDASEESLNLLNENGIIKNYKYIHFATHGVVPGQFNNLTETAIVLSLFGDNYNDGFLTMSDILKLKLNADLVTLSACQTGLVIDSNRNQGISDLSRAFFYAGTPRVVSTLWSIADDPTAELMKDFYGQLEKNKSKTSTLKALNRAKYKMIKNKDFSHPFYWAGFILIGEM